MSLREGVELDHRYTLIQRLGEGGQGSVWKALDRNTGHERALKIVHLPGQDREAAERARREAHLVKDARHPAVVACHSLFEIPAEDVLVLVFDFVQATPLTEVLGDERFGRAHKLAALRHIARALAFLHERGVVHRDLKPDKVLVTPVFWEDPAAPSGLKVIDFGIAAPRRGADGNTLSGMFGTPPYMAPELFEVAGLEAQRSFTQDVYAWGVIGWEMLDGRHPTGLPQGTRGIVFRESYGYQRRSRDPWPPRQLEGRWGSVIAACLALDPAQRPQDGSAILSLLDGPPETLPRSSAVERTTPMLPEVVQVAPEAPKKPQPPAEREPPSAPSPDEAQGLDSAEKGTWQAMAVALVLLSLVAAGTAWLLFGKGSSQPDAAGSPGVSSSAASPTATTVWLAPPGSGMASNTASASPVELCCPRGEKQCRSGRSCKTEGCKAREEQLQERVFVPRVIRVEEEESPYDDEKRNLADPKGLPDSIVCVRAAAGEACATMKAIATGPSARLDRTSDGSKQAPLRVSTSEVRKGTLQLRIKNKGSWARVVKLSAQDDLSTSVLCKSLTLHDEGGRLFLTFYLDDPPTDQGERP